MSKKFTIAMLGTVSALALGHAYPVAAQAVDQPAQPSASAANGGDLEEVVVTARRREEKAQTVPLRMTVVSSELLQDLSVQTPGELMMLSPGFNTFVNGQGQATQQYVWMRGITGVTAYFSEVPTNFSGQALYFDLDNIQVLEGPQGTLFGVSSDSGAVLFQPKKPTNDFGGYAQVTLGDYNRHDLDLVANIPIVDDKLMVRVGGQYYHTDGWIKDVVQNKDLNDIDYWNGRISATLRPTDNVENYFVANFFYTDTNGTAYRVDDFNPLGATAKLYAGSLAQYMTEIHQPYGIAYGVPGAIGTIAEQKQLNIADILTWDVNDNITIKNIAGYSEVTTLGRGNAPDMPYPIYVTLSPTASGPLVTYTDEPQLQGKLFNDKLSFVVGGYLLFDHTIDPAPSVSEIFGAKSGTLSSSDERTQAIYLQGTYDLAALLEGLSFTAGYRYSWDYRAAWQQSLNANLVKTGAPLASDGNFHAPNFTFVVNYQVLPETMVYASFSKAYSSGGFNLAAPPQFHEYNPEYVKDYEIGIKTDFEFLGIKARDNLNAFYSSYNNIQAQINVEYTNAAGLLTDSSFILNGAQGVSKGIEDQFQVIPTEGLTLSGNLAIIDAHYTHYLSQILQPGFPEVNGVTDLSGAKFLIAPLLKYELNARYKLPLDGSFGDMFVSANYAWQQHVGLSISATPENTLGSFATVDMTVDWKGVMGWSNIDASFSATNLLNNRWRDGENGLYNSFGVWGISVADPREFAVKLRYQFGAGSNSLF